MSTPSENTKDESLVDQLNQGTAPDLNDSSLRYAAYANRFRTVAVALSRAQRYLAYTSDFAESFRPVVPGWLVTAGYGVSWLYVTGDVSYQAVNSYHAEKAWIAKKRAGELTAEEEASPPVDWRALTARRAVFQSLASMALPAFTIHSIVKLGIKAFAKSPNPTLKNWGPVALGLGAIPALPYMFDEPVEHVVDSAFDYMVSEYRKKNPPTW